MAELKSEIIVKAELRPCIVRGKNALFHRWSYKPFVGPTSPFKDGHVVGVVSHTIGIVEFEDGIVYEALPSDIRFIDHPHKNYAFDEREANNARERI